MRKLIISWECYDWIFDHYSMIKKEPSIFDIMIVNRGDKPPIYGMEDLCTEAIVAQRRCDIEFAGRELGIKKMFGLGYDGKNIIRLTAQIQLYIATTGIREVYATDVEELRTILKQLNLKFLSFEKESYINMDKLKLIDAMVGIP